MIAKRLGSVYRPGTRSKDWRKVKNRRRVTLRVGGYTEGSGNRTSTFGALLVGRPGPDGTLSYAGGVGTGFDQPTLESLTAALRDLRTSQCPFDPPPPPAVQRTATWVDPVLSAEIEIAEFTNDGLVRHAHPRFRRQGQSASGGDRRRDRCLPGSRPYVPRRQRSSASLRCGALRN